MKSKSTKRSYIDDADIDPDSRLVAEAEAELLGLIHDEASPRHSLGKQEVVSRGINRLNDIRELLEEAERPDRRYPVIHIAGTSGKGSVATFVASICEAAGIRAGLHTTPYLQTPLEKLVCHGSMAKPNEFRELVDFIGKVHDKMRLRKLHYQPRYGSSWVAITLEFFRRKEVDLAILEAGAGGRFDLTNVVSPLITAVTSVGLDHIKTLGPTLRDIAWHKAGIFKRDVPALMLETSADIEDLLVGEGHRIGASVRVLREGRDYQARSSHEIAFLGKCIRCSYGNPQMLGTHQIRNAVIAMAIADEMALAGFPLSRSDVEQGIRNARAPGRLELMSESPAVYIDGAHNADKATALARTLGNLLGDRRLVLVLGVLGYKAVEEITAPLASLASRVVATEPNVFMKAAYPAQDLKKLASKYCRMVDCEPDPIKAVSIALDSLSGDDVVCVTGSVYLAGNVRSAWHPIARIIAEGNSWPNGHPPEVTNSMGGYG